MQLRDSLTEDQMAWLETLAERIPVLFEFIEAGQYKAEFIVGTRTINKKSVRLKLVVEVIEGDDAKNSSNRD